MDEDTAIEQARKPGAFICPECDEKLFSLMDKLSICLYGKCLSHDLKEHQEENIINIMEEL